MTGGQNDIKARLKSLLPGGWFRDATPILDGVLSGVSSALSFAYSLIQYARAQARIATATGGFLDLASRDFFGAGFPRRPAEMDAAFRQRILAQLFLEKATRKGLVRALEILTGRTPRVFEPARPADTGGYGIACGYGAAGGWGSLQLPHQIFVTAYRPLGQGIPTIAGYGSPSGGYSTPSYASYASLDQIVGQVTDADVYSAVDRVMPAAAVAWTRIES